MPRYTLKAVLVSVLLMGPQSGRAADENGSAIAGTVYLDSNGNGTRDNGEQGLAGVRVTDGVTFVTTDGNGHYTIDIGADEMFPFHEAQCVYPSWPSGLWPSSERWWARISDIKDTQHVDFGMKRVPTDEEFSFAAFGDEHSNKGHSYLRLAEEINALPRVRFVVVLGDYGYAVRDTAHQTFGDIAKAAGVFNVPVFHVPGNHDMVVPPKGEDPQKEDIWGYHTQHLGPPRFSFDYGGTHFVAFDSDRYDPEAKTATHGHPISAAKWLQRDLEKVDTGTPTFVLTHWLYGNDGVTGTLRKQKSRFAYMGHSHVASCVDTDGTMGAVSFAMCVTAVKDGRFAVGERVLGGRGHSGYGLSGIHYWDSCTIPGITAYHRDPLTWVGAADKTVRNLDTTPADWAHIIARFKVPENGSVGLRIGKDQAVDIVYENDSLIVDGLAFDAPVSREGRERTWQILVDKPYMGYMTLVTGEAAAGDGTLSRTRVMLPVQVDAPACVTPTGQTDAFTRVELYALNPIKWPAAFPLYHWSPHGWKWGVEHYIDLFSGIDNERSKEMRQRYGIE